jgi:benzoylformate decarboxylase
VLEEEVDGGVPPHSALPPPAPGGGTQDLARLLAAHDPAHVVVMIGDDVPAEAASGALALAHAGGFIVYGTQVTSRAAFPAVDPCWGGMLKPDFAVIRQKLEGVEAVLLIGSRAFVAYAYRDVQPIPEGTRFYHVAASAEAIGREFAADFAVTGDLAVTLSAVAASLYSMGDRKRAKTRLAILATDKAERAASIRSKIEAMFDERPLPADAAVLSVLNALPANTLIANDSAATFGPVQEIMRTEPGLYFFARGGVLGCSMPAAVGASLAHDGPVACFVGDGGAMYSPQALWSAAHYKTRTIFFIFNNRRYNVLMNVARDLGTKNAVAGRFIGMDLIEPAVDFQALAKSMGVPSCHVEGPQEIATATHAALERHGPTLIEIPIA